MIDLFNECEDFNGARYDDDTTWYSCATDMPSVALELQIYAIKLFCWFKKSHLKGNPGKKIFTWYQET